MRLELLGAEERESILAGWNATAREVLPGSLPYLFAAQAGKRPDATAVVFERGRLSYGELDRRVEPACASSARVGGWSGDGCGAVP